MKLPRPRRSTIDWVERVLQLHVLCIAMLAGILVDLNRDGESVAPVLTIAAVCGFLLTDYFRWLHIPRFLVGVITLGAIIPLSMGFWESDTQGQLNQITYLLTIWLSVIFFQEKTPRVYGSLIVLSLLLVVIAAILSEGIAFAAWLFVFEFVALSALVLLYVHTGQISLQSKYQAGVQQLPELSQSLKNPYGTLLGRPPIAFQDPHSLPQRGRMWHNATLYHTAAMCAATVVFGAGFFYAVPRVNQGDWTTPRQSLGPKVGFSTELTFEEMSRILKSDELAFRITFSDARTGRDYPLVQEAYIQGIALTEYETDAQGKTVWRQSDRGAGMQVMSVDSNFPGEIIRQEILLQPSVETTLFAVPPVFGSADTADFIRIDRQGGRVFRPQVDEHGTGRQHRYVLYTTGIRNNAQMPLVPITRFDSFNPGRFSHDISPAEKRKLLEIDELRFPKLIETARQIAAQATEPNNRISLARQLQDHFQSKERFKYTLDLREVQQKRNPRLDPIEDFVANHHTGHCEYYASALALMLRSVDIPSRVVVGYYGGEYNRLGGYYQIYQRDAHAWVEAYLEPGQVPRGPLADAIPEGGAAWYRLDPTPPEEEDLEQKGPMATVDQFLDYAQLLWNDYVLDMNAQQQRAAVLDNSPEVGPFGESALVTRLRELVRHWLAGPQEFLADWRRAGWWNWRGGVVAAVVSALAYFLYSALQWVRAKWIARAQARRQRRSRNTIQPVEFYRRLEQMLAKIGYERREGQTQREFALQAGKLLADASSLPDAAAWPARIVDYFYRVRFGQRQLAPDEQGEVDQFLQSVDAAVNSELEGRT